MRSYLDSAWYIGTKVFRLKEVCEPVQLDKIPFLTDAAKIQRQ